MNNDIFNQNSDTNIMGNDANNEYNDYNVRDAADNTGVVNQDGFNNRSYGYAPASGESPYNHMNHQWQPYSAPQYTSQYTENNKKKEKKEKEKKSFSFGKVIGTCVAFMMTTIIINTSIIYVAFDKMSDEYITKSEYATNNIGTTSDTITTILSETGSSLSVAQVAEAVMPSVVAITSTSIIESNGYPFYGYGGSYQTEGAGSGIIVGKNDTELLIATNNHVVENTTSLSVQFTNDVSVDQAYVKGTSADNDIALVAIPLEAIDTDTINYIKIATLGDSDAMNVGDGVIAIGNALGYGQSLTVGYVSAKDREIAIDNNTLTVIQTDAAINGGNSGGALLNMNGEVIGINVAKSSSYDSSSTSVEGMGYAIPISEAKDIIEELSNKETRYPVPDEDKGYMGVKVVTSDSSSAQYYNIPEGAYVREVTNGGPAQMAGIASGDVIIAVDGDDVSTSDELVSILDTYAAGETVTITVMIREGRDYVEKDVQVTLEGADVLEGIS